MPFVVLMAFAAGAVAVDIGHLYLARAELQTAADAAALAGAASLLSNGGSTPNWSAAQAAGASAVALNTSDGAALRDSNPTSVKIGYWNVTGTPAGLQATTITPGSNDTAAVQVTVSRAPGSNGGPVSYFLAPLFGMQNGSASATSVAMVSGAGTIAAGGLFPMAVSQCVLQNYWNTSPAANLQIGDSGGTTTPNCPTDKKGQALATGVWTNLGTANNSGNPSIQSLINSSPESINDPIVASNLSVRASLYQEVSSYLNTTVIVPIVADATVSTSQPILAFAAFYITSVSTTGSSKYIVGHFVAKLPTTVGNGQVGPSYGSYLPPRLVQ